jgi:hypothetical protein
VSGRGGEARGGETAGAREGEVWAAGTRTRAFRPALALWTVLVAPQVVAQHTWTGVCRPVMEDTTCASVSLPINTNLPGDGVLFRRKLSKESYSKEKCIQRVVTRAGNGTAYGALKKAVCGQGITKHESTTMRQLLKRKLDAICGKACELNVLGQGLGLNENLFTVQIHITPSPRLQKAIDGLGMERFSPDFECHMEVSSDTASCHDSGPADAQTSEQHSVRIDECGLHQAHVDHYRCEQEGESGEHQAEMVDYTCEQTGDERIGLQKEEAESEATQLSVNNIMTPEQQEEIIFFEACREIILEQTRLLSLMDINAPGILGEVGREALLQYKAVTSESSENCNRALRKLFYDFPGLLHEIGLNNPVVIYSWIYENLCKKNSVQLIGCGRKLQRETSQYRLSKIIENYKDPTTNSKINIEASTAFAMLRRLCYYNLHRAQLSHPMLTLSDALSFLTVELQLATQLRIKVMAEKQTDANFDNDLDHAIRNAFE